jgi:DNA-binding FadR family transcriptional regulator
VAALAARRRTEADLSELERALQDCERLAPTGAREETSACHAQFHAAVLRAAHNQAVCAVLEPLSELILDSAEPQQSEGSFPLEQHQRLYRSIRAGDPEATRVAVEEHYANS